MRNKIPKKLLKSSYRKEMWKNVEKVVARIEKVLPISSMHLVGSFAAKKRRPADVDFIVLLHTPKHKKRIGQLIW
jgi:predicted nucleotidyltransferase